MVHLLEGVSHSLIKLIYSSGSSHTYIFHISVLNLEHKNVA